MLRIKKILCPTDFSEPSYVSLETANDIALHFVAELILVHVVTPPHLYPSYPVGGSGFNPVLFVEEMIEASRQRMDEVVKTRVSADLSLRTVVQKGNPADQIVELADSENVDLIVIATHGWTGWRRFISGSVTERVVRHTNRPVFTVPAPQEEE
jgi:nucleotide-binding universal stress UspA family protein